MKPELHTSEEMSKKLKDNDFPQEGCSAYWCESRDRSWVELLSKEDADKEARLIGYRFAAPAVQEIAEHLPGFHKLMHYDESLNFRIDAILNEAGEHWAWMPDVLAEIYIQLKKVR